MQDIYLYPTPEEQKLLEQKAEEMGISVAELVAFLIRDSLQRTKIAILEMVK